MSGKNTYILFIDALWRGSKELNRVSHDLLSLTKMSGDSALQYSLLNTRSQELTKQMGSLSKEIAAGTGNVSENKERWKALHAELVSNKSAMDKLTGASIPAKRSFLEMAGVVAKFATAAGIAVTAAVKLSKWLFDIGSQGARLQQVRLSFDDLNESMLRYPELLEDMRRASRGTIDDITLMSNIFTLVSGSSGELTRMLADSAPRILEIAKAAAKLNPTLGDTTFMYESLARGIKRAEFRLIDNLGLNVRVGEANKRYAEQIGKTVEELTAEERQIALLNEVMRVGNNLIAQAGGSTASLADAYEEVTANATNLKNQLKITVGLWLQSADIMPVLSDWLANVASQLEDYNTALAEQIELRNRLNELEEQAATRGQHGSFGWSEEEAKSVTDSIRELNRVVEENFALQGGFSFGGGIGASSMYNLRRAFEHTDFDTAGMERDIIIAEKAMKTYGMTAERTVEFITMLHKMEGDPNASAWLARITSVSQYADLLGVAQREHTAIYEEIQRSRRAMMELGPTWRREVMDEMRKAPLTIEETIDRQRDLTEELEKYRDMHKELVDLRRELVAATGDKFIEALDSDLLKLVTQHGKTVTLAEPDTAKVREAFLVHAIALQNLAEAQKEFNENTDANKAAELELAVIRAGEAVQEAAKEMAEFDRATAAAGTSVVDYSGKIRNELMQALLESADAAGVGATGLALIKGAMGDMTPEAINAAIRIAAVSEQIDLMGKAIARGIEAGLDPQTLINEAEEMVNTFVTELTTIEVPPIPIPVEFTPPTDAEGLQEFFPDFTALDYAVELNTTSLTDGETTAVSLKALMEAVSQEGAYEILLDYQDLENSHLMAKDLLETIEAVTSKEYTIRINVEYDDPGPPSGAEESSIPPPFPPPGNNMANSGGGGSNDDIGDMMYIPPISGGSAGTATTTNVVGGLAQNYNFYNYNAEAAAITTTMARQRARDSITEYLNGTRR